MRKICVLIIAILLVGSYVVSFPNVGNWLPHKSPKEIVVDWAPTSGTPSAISFVSKAGAVPTVRFDLMGQAFCIVLWKGAIHFQWYNDSSDAQLDLGPSISPAFEVVNFYGPSKHWADEPYIAHVYDGWNLLGFMLRWSPAQGYPHPQNMEYACAVPIWLILLIFTIYLARRSKWRFKKGTCKMCGYDLRATPHKCPECGHSTLGQTE